MFWLETRTTQAIQSTSCNQECRASDRVIYGEIYRPTIRGDVANYTPRCVLVIKGEKIFNMSTLEGRRYIVSIGVRHLYNFTLT